MSDVAAAPQRPETMTPRQLDRRRRVLDAVHELLAERPLHEIQVKEIADRAQVSLAAIYRYFASKEHLLAEALLDWAARGGRRPSTGGTAERFAGVLRRGVGAYRKAPQYAELFLETFASRDPYAVECMGRLSSEVSGGMRDALVGVEPEVAETIRMTIGNAWLGGLFECVHGRTSFAELEKRLVAAAELFVEPFSPEVAVR